MAARLGHILERGRLNQFRPGHGVMCHTVAKAQKISLKVQGDVDSVRIFTENSVNIHLESTPP
jgi:hypothetical protein